MATKPKTDPLADLLDEYPILAPYMKIPELKKILGLGAKENWSPQKFSAKIQGSVWYRTHNAEQRRWITLTQADQGRLVEARTTDLEDYYRKVFGMDAPAGKFRAQASRIARGDYTFDKFQKDFKASKEYQQRFIGNTYRVKAGLSELSPEEYRATEDAYKQQLRQYGLDPSRYDRPDDFAALFARDVSPKEFSDRLSLWRYVTTQAGAHVKNAFQAHAGIAGVKDEDIYGMMTGQNDLAHQYAAKTGTQPLGMPSIVAQEEALKQAQSEEKALFSAGGQVKGLETQAGATF